MKVKLDENVHGDVAGVLISAGHDATTVYEQTLAGHPDTDIAAAVRTEGRCLITFDLDFSDVRKFPPRNNSPESSCSDSTSLPPDSRLSA